MNISLSITDWKIFPSTFFRSINNSLIVNKIMPKSLREIWLISLAFLHSLFENRTHLDWISKHKSMLGVIEWLIIKRVIVEQGLYNSSTYSVSIIELWVNVTSEWKSLGNCTGKSNLIIRVLELPEIWRIGILISTGSWIFISWVEVVSDHWHECRQLHPSSTKFLIQRTKRSTSINH